VFLPNGAANAARIAAQPGGHVRRFASAANNAFGATIVTRNHGLTNGLQVFRSGFPTYKGSTPLWVASASLAMG
jgi:hypothetical protein